MRKRGGTWDEASRSCSCAHRSGRTRSGRTCCCRHRPNAYKAKARSAKQLRELKRLGFDITEGQRRRGIEIVATKSADRKLRRRPGSRRRSSVTGAAARAAAWPRQPRRPTAGRSGGRTRGPTFELSDSAGNPTANIMTQMERLAAAIRNITKLETIGSSSTTGADLRDEGHEERPHGGRRHAASGPVLLRPARARVARRRDRPPHAAPLHRQLRPHRNGARHRRAARCGRVARRSSRTSWTPASCGSSSSRTQTATTSRLTRRIGLWRKNLRDNNGDGQITAVDGVDPNRNFPTRWNYDDEGSNTDRGLGDVPRARSGLRARDAGLHVADGPRALRVQQERPHLRSAAPMAARMAGGHPLRRRADHDGARGG